MSVNTKLKSFASQQDAILGLVKSQQTLEQLHANLLDLDQRLGASQELLAQMGALIKPASPPSMKAVQS